MNDKTDLNAAQLKKLHFLDEKLLALIGSNVQHKEQDRLVKILLPRKSGEVKTSQEQDGMVTSITDTSDRSGPLRKTDSREKEYC